MPIEITSSTRLTGGVSYGALTSHAWISCPVNQLGGLHINDYYGYAPFMVTVNGDATGTLPTISITYGAYDWENYRPKFVPFVTFSTTEEITLPFSVGWSHTFSGTYSAKQFINGPLCDWSGYSATVEIVRGKGTDETIIDNVIDGINGSYGKKVLADYDQPRSLLLEVSGVHAVDKYPLTPDTCGDRYDRAYVCDINPYGSVSSMWGSCGMGLIYSSPMVATGDECWYWDGYVPMYAKGYIEVVPGSSNCDSVNVYAYVKLYHLCYRHWGTPPADQVYITGPHCVWEGGEPMPRYTAQELRTLGCLWEGVPLLGSGLSLTQTQPDHYGDGVGSLCPPDYPYNAGCGAGTFTVTSS